MSEDTRARREAIYPELRRLRPRQKKRKQELIEELRILEEDELLEERALLRELHEELGALLAADDQGPFSVDLRELASARRAIEGGNLFAIIDALMFCERWHLPPPYWLHAAIVPAVWSYVENAKGRTGKRKWYTQWQQDMGDLEIADAVEYALEEGRSPDTGWSLDAERVAPEGEGRVSEEERAESSGAFTRAAELLAITREGKAPSPETVRYAYRRVWRRGGPGNYWVGPTAWRFLWRKEERERKGRQAEEGGE